MKRKEIETAQSVINQLSDSTSAVVIAIRHGNHNVVIHNLGKNDSRQVLWEVIAACFAEDKAMPFDPRISLEYTPEQQVEGGEQ